MKRILCVHFGLVLLLACFSPSVAAAQEHAQAPAPAQTEPAAQSEQQPVVNPDAAAGRDLANASEAAEHAEEGKGHEENAEFKYSAMVGKLGRMVGIDAVGMYWVSISINFAVLAVFFWMLLKTKLPQMFRRAHQHHPEGPERGAGRQRGGLPPFG